MTLTRKEKVGERGVSATRLRKLTLTLGLATAVAAVAAWMWIVVYDNYHTVIQNELYRSAQVSAAELRHYIERDGLKTVISLRARTNASWWVEEKAVCRESGVAHLDFPLEGGHTPTREEMKRLVDVVRGATRPILVHCKHGADRTSLAVALYLHERDTPAHDPEDAFSTMYGHLPMIFRSTRCYDDAYDVWARSERMNEDTDGTPGQVSGGPAQMGAARQGPRTRGHEGR